MSVTCPIFSSLFQGSSGSKSKVDCTAIIKVWTTGMLVVAERQPEKLAGAPTFCQVGVVSLNNQLINCVNTNVRHIMSQCVIQ